MASSSPYLLLFFCLLLSYHCFKAHAAPHTIIKQVLSSVANKPHIYDHEGDEPQSSRRRHHGYHGHDEPDYDRPDRKEEAGYSPFVLEEPVVAVRTEAGEIRRLPKDRSSVLMKNNIGLNFITLEPKALLLPQYIDADCVFLVNTGKPRLSFVNNNELQEIDLELGDMYRIKGGTVFYLYNPDEGQKAHIFSIFDTSKVLQHGRSQAFFVAGGYDPQTIFSGFDDDVIATAMKVSREEVRDILNHQNKGPIIYSAFNTTEREPERPWQLRSMMGKFLAAFADAQKKPYNIFKKSPDFNNDYGRAVTVNGKDCEMLKKADLGVFAVSLKAGALLAPHWNPSAAEIGVVIKGEGAIQISFPNGTNALNKKVGAGSVFFVPQYHPMCQIASRSGPFEFVGFSTSARTSHPQFLAGNNSVLKALNRDVLASAFDISPDMLKDILEAQQDVVILPGRVEEAPDA